METTPLRNCLAGLLALALAGAASAEDAFGRVSSVAGHATAQRPGEAPRSLACGDPVYADDTLETGPDARVGVQLGDVATHLDANTRVRLGELAGDAPAVRLEIGRVRMIDPRDSGAPAQLSALDADARVMGNDTEGYIFGEKVGSYAMMCEWDEPLPVSRGREEKTANPGECVIAKPKEPLYTADAHEARIPAVADLCEAGPGLAALNSPLNHLSPRDVAAGPPVGPDTAGLGGFSPTGLDGPGRQPCDTAVGSCNLPVPIGAIEPPPDTGGPPVPGE